MWEVVYYLVILTVGLFSFLFSLSNLIFMARNTKPAVHTTGPLISVLIPARNEESNIGACLRSLLDQTYDNYEILVLDDDSTDSTWDIVQAYAKKHPRVRPLKGESLPEGWNGKNFALHQLGEQARGEYYLLVDADTIHSPESLSFAYSNMIYHDTDMISGYPKQILPSISAQAVVTAMHFNILFLTPLWLQKHLTYPFLGLAIGQYIFVRAEAFHAVGGYEPIREVITDDIHFARLLLSYGYHQLFLDIGGIVSCSMYDSFLSSFRGISRSIIDFFDRHLVLPMFAAPLAVLFLVAPTYILVYQLMAGMQVPLTLLLGTAFLYAAWAQTTLFLRYSVKTLFLFCPTMSLIVIMFLQGVFNTITGRGYVWKERIVK